MRTPACPRCAEQRWLRAQAEGASAGDAFALQKALHRLERTVQELSAVAAMLDTRLAVRSDRTISEMRLAEKIA